MTRTAAVMAVALVSGAALASEWQNAFDAKAAGDALGREGAAVLVAGAGAPRDEVRAAARALVATLREGGRAKLVMDDAALGSLESASDEDIKKKAAAMPWDVLVIVRVYPGTAGSGASAVATLWDKAGTALGSLTGAAAAPAPAATTLPPPPPPPPAGGVDERTIHFGQKGLVTADKSSLLYDSVYVGRKKLSALELYDLLGREDFARAARSRGGLKLGVGLGGGALIVGAGAMWWFSVTSRCVRVQFNRYGPCLEREIPNLTVPAIGVAIAGLGAIITAIALPGQAAPKVDVLEAIDTYNASSGPKAKLQLVPHVGAEGAGLSLAGAF